MASDRATIEAELTGAPKVEADAKKINRALADTKKSAGEGIAAGFNKATAGAQVFGAKADALRGVLSPTAIFGGVIGGGIASTISSITEYLGQAADKARDFGDKTSAAGRRAGLDINSLRASLARNATSTLQSTDAQLDFVDSVQQLTYGGKGAAESLKTVGDVATALGRTDKDFAPLVASLQTIYGLNVDVGREMNTLIEKAQRLHTIGGAQALLDSVAALRPALAQVSHQSEEAKNKLLALQAVLLSKGFTPEEATAVTGQLPGLIKRLAPQIARTPGVGLKYSDIIDPDTGQPRDPVATAQRLKDTFLKSKTKGLSKDEAALKVALGDLGGNEILFGTDFAKVNAEAERKKEENSPAAIAARKAAFEASPEGKREALRQARANRTLQVGRIASWIGDHASEAYEQGVHNLGFSTALDKLAPAGAGPDEATTLLKKIADNTDPLKPPALQLNVKAKPAGNH